MTDTDLEVEFLQQLAATEMDDVLILRHDTAHRLLTDGRRRVLEAIIDGDFDSITAISDHLNRPLSAVHRDVDLLFESDVVDYETGPNNAKKPVLSHQYIMIRPLVFDGQMFADELPPNPFKPNDHDDGNPGCESANGPYMCELDAGHDGPHRVRYDDGVDKTWTDESA